MTVPSSTQQAGPFIGNGVTTSFPFTFKCFDRSHLEWITVTNGVETVQVLDSTYSVTLNGDQDANPGGTVTYPLTGSPMAAGTSATLVGKVPMGQTTDLPDGGAFRAAIVEQALDILALQNLQQQDQIDRALRLPVTAPIGSSGELPPPSADKLISWGPDGRTLVNRDVTEVVTTAAYSSWRTDTFSGNGTQTLFVMTADPGNRNNCDVTIGGVTQVAGVNFTTNGILLTFTVAPPAGTNNIAVRYGQALPTGVTDDSSVTVTRLLSGTSTTTQHVVNEYRKIIATVDFNVPSNGTTSATSAIQSMFTVCALAGNVREIEFPDGTYLLTNPNNWAQASCAVTIAGLKRCVIRGGKNTKFIVNASGAGATEFGMFMLNSCEDLEFRDFEMDGSGIVINGAGANRSFSFVLANFDQNNQATDLAPNKRITFRNLYIHDIGGGPSVLPRTTSLPPAAMTEGLRVVDCEMTNLLNVNHGVGACFVRNLVVDNNKFVNNIPAVTPIDNMAVDASRGCINASITNNFVRGFCYGMKCETQINAGPSGTETRASSRVRIENNRLEEIGDPASLVVGGDNTFGIKANGTDVVIRGNTVRRRTVGLTAGGLYAGIIAVNTHNDESNVVVEGNTVFGAAYGALHNDTTASTRECSAVFKNNRFVDCAQYGASLQANVEFDDNVVIRAGTSAVEVQVANMTFVRRNRFFDCASVDNAIIPERVGGVYQSTLGAIGGYTEIIDNVIVDTRGGSAAEYGYFLRGATTFTNPMVFRPGYTTGLLTATAYDSNFNIVGDTMMIGGINRPGPRRILTTNSPAIAAPWSTQAWNVGDRAILHPPVVGSPRGWVCTVSGTPGTWVSEGNL